MEQPKQTQQIVPELDDALYENLGPAGDGVVVVKAFIDESELAPVQQELESPEGIAWRDNHDVFQNKRGLTIVENHDVIALRMLRGDQNLIECLPESLIVARKIERFIRGLDRLFPTLVDWKIDEMSFHRYDDEEVGLSFHRDNLRFTGLIAILAVEGECELHIRGKDGSISSYDTEPGDLAVLRGPGLLDDFDGDERPEHGVYNLKTKTRTSMMLRDNNRPSDPVPGFTYDNWPVTD